MGLQKYKPKATPHMTEDDSVKLHAKCALNVQNTKVIAERTRKLIQESKQLLRQPKKK